MHVYEVIPGIYKFISEVSFFKTYSTGYFRKQQNETGYFCGMTLYEFKFYINVKYLCFTFLMLHVIIWLVLV